MRIAAALIALTVTGIVGLADRGGSSVLTREPAPLRGVPLRGETALRLLVADRRPFVLDVDRESVTPVRGIRAVTRGVLSVKGVAGRAAVVVARSGPDADLYGVRGTRVSALGTGRNVWPAGDGRSVWVQGRVNRSRCTLRQVGLDGRAIRPPRAFPCATGSDPAVGSVGVVVRRSLVLDPRTGRTVLRTRWGVLAAAGRQLLLAGPGKRFTLIDSATGSERRVRWPSTIPWLAEPAADPRGRFIAVAFGGPRSDGGVLDVWLLDTRTGELTQLPEMPAVVHLKRTRMAWTDDGRLVLLGERGGKGFVAVWRPGRRRLPLKNVQLPDRTGGSASFAPLR